MKIQKSVCFTLFLLVIVSNVIHAKNKNIHIIPAWLRSEVLTLPLPAFHQSKGVNGQFYTIQHMLEEQEHTIWGWWPKAGEPFLISGSDTLNWVEIEAQSNGYCQLYPKNDTIPQFLYLATYIQVDRYTQAVLELESLHPCRVFIDGEILFTKYDSHTNSAQAHVNWDISLEPGKHLLLIKLLYDPGNAAEWSIKSKIRPAIESNISVTTSSLHRFGIQDILNQPRVTDVQISPDGKRIILTKNQTFPNGNEESWFELRKTMDGTLLQSFKGFSCGWGVRWSPHGQQISFLTTQDDLTTIWLINVETGTVIALKGIYNIFHNIPGHLMLHS
jgi:hypothetical protein